MSSHHPRGNLHYPLSLYFLITSSCSHRTDVSLTQFSTCLLIRHLRGQARSPRSYSNTFCQRCPKIQTMCAGNLPSGLHANTETNYRALASLRARRARWIAPYWKGMFAHSMKQWIKGLGAGLERLTHTAKRKEVCAPALICKLISLCNSILK